MTYRVTVFMLHQIRKLSTSQSLRARKNHYDSLGLTKGATQSDIKGAYYELSKVYHPDKNQGNTQQQKDIQARKFRDITEAYEVLGNAKTRRLYDKGFMGDHHSHGTHHTSTTKEDPLHKFYKSRETRHRPPSSGGVPIYDFDEWSKQHYSHAFQRDQEMKARHAFYKKMRDDHAEDQKNEVIVYGLVFLTGICTFLKLFLESDYKLVVFRMKRGTAKDVD